VTVETLSKPSPDQDRDQAHDRDWWRGAVIYQIYPRSFADSNGDGVGDLPGVTAHLEHVASLGVDAIWLSPFFTSPMKDFGYDVSDYEGVDPIFGTLADFDRLVDKAHALGLKVIIDQVFSHTSDQHPWFRASRQDRTNPKADWYVWADAKPDGSPPSNWQSVFGGPSWTWDARRRQYYLHNFLSAQPDLNVHSPQVQDALVATSRFWLERGVDGFRFDAINFAMHDQALTDNPPILDGGGKRTRPFDFQHHFHNQSHDDIPAFLSRLRQLGESYGGRFMVAEVGGERADSEMKLYTEGPDRLHSAYGFLYLYADTLTPALIRQGAAMWPAGRGRAGRPGRSRTTTRRGRCRAGPGAATPRPSPRCRCCCWSPCAAMSSFTRARSWACRRRRCPMTGCGIPRRSPTGPRPWAATGLARRCPGSPWPPMPASPRSSPGCRSTRPTSTWRSTARSATATPP
jgi:alpha-glucosidase